MRFGLTDDQQLFRETTTKFLEDTCPLDAVRRIAKDEPGGFDRDWWRRGAELGWTSMLVSEEHGGGSVSGRPLADLALVAEEMGRLVSPGPLIPTNVVAAALSRAGSPAQHKQLAGLVSGETVATWCPDGMSMRRGPSARTGAPRRVPGRRLRPRRHHPAGGGRRRGGPAAGDRPVRPRAGPVRGPFGRRRGVDDAGPTASTWSGGSPACGSTRWRWPPTPCSVSPGRWTPTSSASSRTRSSSSAPRWPVPSTGSSSSPSSTPRTGSRSAGRWPRTRRSSTGSPT